MNKIPAGQICLVVIIGSLLHFGCSLSTSGTETGNPDITARLIEISEFFDTADLWIPSTYLVEGEEQLNPERVSSQLKNYHIAKRMVDSSSDQETPETTYTVTFSIDTLLIPDTHFIKDTILSDTIITDTLNNDSIINPSFMFISQYIRYDSIIIVDTIVKTDTLLIEKSDTLWSPPRSGQPFATNVQIVLSDKTSDDTTTYIISRDSTTGKIILVHAMVVTTIDEKPEYTMKAISPVIRSGLSYIMVGERTTSNNLTISEAYHYLNSNYLSEPLGTSKPPLMSRGILTYTDTISEINIKVDFDPGNDLLFSTTADNRISSLQRNALYGGIVAERIRYGNATFETLQDTILLQRNRTALNDSIETQTTKYFCITGTDPKDHRNNRLVTVNRETHLVNCKAKKILCSIMLDTPLEKGMFPSSATFRCTIDYGKGLTGQIDAAVDYFGKTISGTYSFAGTESVFTFSMTDGTTTME